MTFRHDFLIICLHWINKTGLQPVSRPAEQVPLLRGLGVGAKAHWWGWVQGAKSLLININYHVGTMLPVSGHISLELHITPAIVPYSPVSYWPVNKQVTLNLCTDL